MNVGQFCILRPLAELEDHDNPLFARLGARFELDETAAPIVRRHVQLIDLPDMVHACWEMDCSVQVRRNVPQVRERRRVIGDMETWVHVHEGGSVYIDNPWRHGGSQFG